MKEGNCVSKPSYVTSQYCLCQGGTACTSQQVCGSNGECRIPNKCEDPTLEKTLNLEIKSDEYTLQEGFNITIGCKDCHYFTNAEFENINAYDLKCNADGKWNRSIEGCSKLECSSLSVDTNTAEEIDLGSCKTWKHVRCSDQMEYLEFDQGKSWINYECTRK